MAITATFKSYPSIADIGLELNLLVLFAPLLEQLTFKLLFIAHFYIFSAVLTWLTWSAWIMHGSGNANFYYGANLALCAAQSWLIVDCIRHFLDDEHSMKSQQQSNQHQQKKTN